MARRTKISAPRPTAGKPKGGYYRKSKASLEWLHGRRGPSGQRAQSPIKEWADMTPAERMAVMVRAGK